MVEIVYYAAARFPVADIYLTQFFHSASIVGKPTAVTNFSHCDVADKEIDAAKAETDTEKQVAARLGLSQTTTHQYVMALYRHFGVTSRAQLLAHMIKRIGRRGSTGHPAGGAGVSPDP